MISLQSVLQSIYLIDKMPLQPTVQNHHQSQFKWPVYSLIENDKTQKHVYSWSLLLTELVARYALTLLKLNYHDKLNTQMAKAKAEHGSAMAPTCQTVSELYPETVAFPMESSTC